jgi:hypothetical protein
VIQKGAAFGLAQKAIEVGLLPGHFARQHFQSDLFLFEFVKREKHGAHAPFAQEAQNAVIADALQPPQIDVARRRRRVRIEPRLIEAKAKIVNLLASQEALLLEERKQRDRFPTRPAVDHQVRDAFHIDRVDAELRHGKTGGSNLGLGQHAETRAVRAEVSDRSVRCRRLECHQKMKNNARRG